MTTATYRPSRLVILGSIAFPVLFGCRLVSGFGPGQFTRYWGILGAVEDRIHLAGEHTATFGQGYLDGAIESGERAARDVLHDFGLELQEPSKHE